MLNSSAGRALEADPKPMLFEAACTGGHPRSRSRAARILRRPSAFTPRRLLPEIVRQLRNQPEIRASRPAQASESDLGPVFAGNELRLNSSRNANVAPKHFLKRTRQGYPHGAGPSREQ